MRLRDLGNSLIVVEHDEDTMRAADCVVDIGPGAGEHGGKLVEIGTAEDTDDRIRTFCHRCIFKRHEAKFRCRQNANSRPAG